MADLKDLELQHSHALAIGKQLFEEYERSNAPDFTDSLTRNLVKDLFRKFSDILDQLMVLVWEKRLRPAGYAGHAQIYFVAEETRRASRAKIGRIPGDVEKQHPEIYNFIMARQADDPKYAFYPTFKRLVNRSHNGLHRVAYSKGSRIQFGPMFIQTVGPMGVKIPSTAPVHPDGMGFPVEMFDDVAFILEDVNMDAFTYLGQIAFAVRHACIDYGVGLRLRD